MSRIGKRVIAVPQGVKIEVKSDGVSVSGPKGSLTLASPYGVKVDSKDSKVIVTSTSADKQSRMNHGTANALIMNAIKGVVDGYSRDLVISGTGYSAKVQGAKLTLELGYSHKIELDIPKDLKISCPSSTAVKVEGIDKQKVGNYAAKIRALRPIEPYNLKGIKYSDEIVKKKMSKKQATV